MVKDCKWSTWVPPNRGACTSGSFNLKYRAKDWKYWSQKIADYIRLRLIIARQSKRSCGKIHGGTQEASMTRKVCPNQRADLQRAVLIPVGVNRDAVTKNAGSCGISSRRARNNLLLPGCHSWVCTASCVVSHRSWHVDIRAFQRAGQGLDLLKEARIWRDARRGKERSLPRACIPAFHGGYEPRFFFLRIWLSFEFQDCPSGVYVPWFDGDDRRWGRVIPSWKPSLWSLVCPSRVTAGFLQFKCTYQFRYVGEKESPENVQLSPQSMRSFHDTATITV